MNDRTKARRRRASLPSRLGYRAAPLTEGTGLRVGEGLRGGRGEGWPRQGAAALRKAGPTICLEIPLESLMNPCPPPPTLPAGQQLKDNFSTCLSSPDPSSHGESTPPSERLGCAFWKERRKRGGYPEHPSGRKQAPAPPALKVPAGEAQQDCSGGPERGGVNAAGPCGCGGLRN